LRVARQWSHASYATTVRVAKPVPQSTKPFDHCGASAENLLEDRLPE